MSTIRLYDSLPDGAAGASITSAASAWGYSSYVTIAAAGFPLGGFVSGVVLQPNVASAGIALDTTYEGIIELYYGASDTLFAQLPFTWRVDTQAEHTHPILIILPEPVQVQGNVRIRARIADSNTSALVHDGVKLLAYANASPSVTLSTPADGATGVSSLPALVFNGVDPTPESEDVRYQVEVDTVNTFNSNAAGTPTYYANGTVTDPNSVWTNDANIADSDDATTPTTYASTTTIGSTSSNYLKVVGTNAPVISGVITKVEIRHYSEHTSAGNVYVTTYVNGAATLNTLHGGSGASWTAYDDITSFLSSWAWNDIQNLEFRAHTANSGEARVYRIDVRITYSAYPVVRATSGTDAGFSGSPDNSDPFASGQDVTYTVQSALSSGTYYWRVRGTDPNGSNAYGSWSSTRSFTVSSGTAYTKTLTETASLSDTILKMALKVASETSTQTDTLKKDSAKTRTETATLSDSVLKQLARILTETVTYSDTLLAVRTFLKTLTETVTHTDSLVRAMAKTLSDTVTHTDTVLKQLARPLTETVTHSDTVLAVRTFLKTLSESTSLSDLLTKFTNKTLSDTATQTDTVVKQTQKLRTETASLTDTLSAIRTFLKTLTETVTGSDSLVKQTNKVASETVTHADTVVKSTAKPRTETATLSDTLTAIRTFLKTLAETLTGSDTLTKQTATTRAETASMSDTVVKSTTKVRTETATLTDTILAAKSFLKTLTETVTSTDSLKKLVGTIRTETASLSDSLLRSIGKLTTETLSLADTLLTQLLNSAAGRILVKVGSAFVAKALKVRVAGSFVTKTVKYFRSGSWHNTPY